MHRVDDRSLSGSERRDTEWVILVIMSPSDRCGSGKNPLPQCAFKVSMFNVSAIHINSRSWLRSSSTHEPSDPPLRIVDLIEYNLRKFRKSSGGRMDACSASV